MRRSLRILAVMLAVVLAMAAPAVTVLAAADEIVTVKWILPGESQTGRAAVLDEINAKLKDQGIALDIQFESFGAYTDKMNMMISSQEEFDLCMTTASWLNLYLPNVAKGAFVDITDLIDTCAPELRETLPDFCFEQAKVNGRIYAIPNYQICYSSNGVQIRADFAEKYGINIDEIGTYEDLEPYLELVKGNEPGLYPTSGEIGSVDYTHEYVKVDDKIFFRADDLDMKCDIFFDEIIQPYYDLLNTWWKEGYIRQDRATVLDDNADQMSGKYASYAGCVIKPGGDVERKNKTGGSIDWLEKSLVTPYIDSTAVRATMTAVSSSGKNPEAAVKMLGIMNTDKEIFNLTNFGIEGVSYDLNGEGKVVKREDANYWINAAWAFGNQFNAILMEGQEDGIWEETDRINREATVSPISGFSFDAEPVSSEVAKINAVIEEYKYIMYAGNYEALFEEYKARLEQAGLSDYIAEIQRQLDEWRAANGK